MISKYLSLVKFSHTIFAMPFALIGFFLALHTKDLSFDWKILLYVVLCMIFARNAAMSFNRYIDRKIDVINPRTSNREIPNGLINANSALIFVIINSILFIITTYFINQLTLFLSPVALLVILGYSFTKRFTSLCHFILGLGLSLAPIGAYISVTGEFSLLPIFFSFIVLFWVSGFDIVYSLQDENFDNNQKLHSIPGFLGRKNAMILSIFLHIISALIIIFIGYYWSFDLLYWIGAIIFIGLLFFQHIIIKPTDLSRINAAFFTTNGIASLIFSVFVIADLYFPIFS